MSDAAPHAPTRNADAVAGFAATALDRDLPAEVIEAARFCLVDWFGVALGSHDQEPVHQLRRVVDGWGAQGRAHILLGGTTAPANAALVNGTMAHCLDFDDTHLGSIAHLSAPIWAAAYAVGTHIGAAPRDIVRAFVCGFEVGARLGGEGLGEALNSRNLHSTGVFGCLGAAAAAGALYRLSPERMKRALGLAATQAGGLTLSFGTPAKPLHAGKAAFNAVLAAELAGEGYGAALDLLEANGGLPRAFVQDGSVVPQRVAFEEPWEITRNTFKPYPSCLLTHPVIDAGKELHPEVNGHPVEAIRAVVHPLAIQLAGKPDPQTAFEGKFSIGFCAALALCGRPVSKGDFSEGALSDPMIKELLPRVELVPDPGMDKRAAELEVRLRVGIGLRSFVPLALGNPGRPMSWDDMRAKFTGLVEPVLGARSSEAFERLRRFDTENDAAGTQGLLRASPSPGAVH